MRLATWNVNSVGARLPRLLPWLEEVAPDVVALQETKCADKAFPHAEVEALGYEVAHNGDGRWNGAALLSRVGLQDVSLSFAGQPAFARDDALLPPAIEARAVGATCGGVRCWSLYVPNGRAVDDPHYVYKLAWLAALRDVLADETAPLVVTGDFNIAPTDDDVWDISQFVGSTHVTPAERCALQAIQDVGLVDIPARPGKGPRAFTYWDYRAGMFHKDLGMRIDLILASPSLTVTDAWVDREARKGKGPSDHAPVVVDLTVP
ncbi:MAG: exodeoxyribonuclease III [Frankiales bacterium]|nr:exodeoxyribonuclease III [Frankiales bacterium]